MKKEILKISEHPKIKELSEQFFKERDVRVLQLNALTENMTRLTQDQQRDSDVFWNKIYDYLQENKIIFIDKNKPLPMRIEQDLLINDPSLLHPNCDCDIHLKSEILKVEKKATKKVTKKATKKVEKKPAKKLAKKAK